VNNEAALAAGPETINPRSGFPLALIPAATAANLKPLGRNIGPESFMRDWLRPDSFQAH
jgi:hypothetical protein